MREIEFRAWCWGVYSMHYSDQVMPSLKQYIDDPDSKVMQYTGLKDKNGVKIYEGDLIDAMRYPFYGDDDLTELNYVGEVYYWIEESAFYVDLHMVSDRVSGRACGGIMSDYYGELNVIGNIYENPELINP